MAELSRLRAGDKVLLRDGSKIVVREMGGNLLVMTHYLHLWSADGQWAPETYPNNPFDIVAVIHCGPRPSSHQPMKERKRHDRNA